VGKREKKRVSVSFFETVEQRASSTRAMTNDQVSHTSTAYCGHAMPPQNDGGTQPATANATAMDRRRAVDCMMCQVLVEM
jgi:hypothetical protein